MKICSTFCGDVSHAASEIDMDAEYGDNVSLALER